MDDGRDAGLHFCVLIHGLWGNPSHLQNIANALHQAHSERVLHILITKSNAGNFTYDGIETGAERVTQEIEQEIETLENSGKRVTKLSVIGYSLGGLIARYCIGLLYSKGLFEKITPINFTTFATPHLGTRTPLLGWHNQLWNTIGGNTLSASGHQLWLIDKFRDTGRPLLSLLADPGSIFIKALSAFKHRNLYANIVNDRSVPFYTAYISRTDPFVDLNAVEIEYDPKCESVVLDQECPAKPRTKALSLYESMALRSSTFLTKAPYYIFVGVIAPVGGIAYFVNSSIQSFQSTNRIKQHEEGNGQSSYRIPYMADGLQRHTEAVFEKLSKAQTEEYLPAEDQPNQSSEMGSSTQASHNASSANVSEESGLAKNAKDTIRPMQTEFPHLALTPEQFSMVDTLDAVGITKHAVHIHRASHSHAAIIVRSNRIGFGEGKIVIRHFIERFEA